MAGQKMPPLSQGLPSARIVASLGLFQEEAKMKTYASMTKPEPRTIALLAGLSMGLSLSVDEIFFLATAVVLLIIPVRCLAHYVYELEQRAVSNRHA
jgi:hypothetical protein